MQLIQVPVLRESVDHINKQGASCSQPNVHKLKANEKASQCLTATRQPRKQPHIDICKATASRQVFFNANTVSPAKAVPLPRGYFSQFHFNSDTITQVGN
ncbi:hypothetical protein Pst134EA_015996 [Puccinia striiformis f. sp. tritici]|uniref:hypothetical protein n=1 Tax=Puccinia striiformis f. sp. tritici TaxID=168172 RepID=UPI0020079FEA|nr:hypothetical protein Pst134EA_015996 [Puccinia striiformis f. sp. tritici]KAH9463915.1 hypothetical protein Pst134EA_015996 [Puccinia striiformis f. sp. tritici]